MIKNLLPRAISTLFFAIAFPVTALCVQFIFYSVMPASYWFEYQAVEPQKPEIGKDDPIIFLSSSTVKRPVTMIWNDRLFCKCIEGRNCNNKDFLLQGSYISKAIKQEPKIIVSAPWVWEGIPPYPPSECYLDTGILITLPFGISKTQTIQGEIFMIK